MTFNDSNMGETAIIYNRCAYFRCQFYYRWTGMCIPFVFFCMMKSRLLVTLSSTKDYIHGFLFTMLGVILFCHGLLIISAMLLCFWCCLPVCLSISLSISRITQ